ncbi:MAG: hypothetical protein ACAI44_00480, partial [Candidatus Sericytochromatia bacterium]
MQQKSMFGIFIGLLAGWLYLTGPGAMPATALNDTDAKARGCRLGGVMGINRILPSWVSVAADDAPQTAEGIVTRSAVTHQDMPTYHTSHDWNFDVKLDKAYHGLYSEVTRQHAAMEMEWEINFFPPEFWPVAGDRVWMMGRWIFDCGHPPYRTELHPVKAVAFTRSEPMILAGDKAPSLTNKTLIYLHGRGGYYNAPIADRSYEFDIHLPAKPSASAELHTLVLETPFGGPEPVLTPIPEANKVHVLYPLALSDPNPERKFAAVVAAGWREPVLTQGYRQLKVTIEKLKINLDHDPRAAGSWRFFARAGSHWMEVPGLDEVNNGFVKPINQSFVVTVPENGALSLQTTGWEDDCDGAFSSINA